MSAAHLDVSVLDAEGEPHPAVRVEAAMVDSGQPLVPSEAVVLDLTRPFGSTHHAAASGRFELAAPPGDVRLRCARGPEHRPAEVVVTLAPGERRHLDLEVARWTDQAASGWQSGDLHGHRRADVLPRLLLSEDLGVGSAIATHNGTPLVPDELLSGPARVTAGADRIASVFDAELERIEGGPGAIVGVGLQAPLRFDAGPWLPLDTEVADRIRVLGGHVDLEKPFWPLAPALVALGKVDSVGVVSNHFGPDWTHTEVAGVGGIVPEAADLDPIRLMWWVCELYARFLDCGFDLPVSAGSASGWMPMPLGHARTYVRGEASTELTVEGWLADLRSGRSFATNGPLVHLEVDGVGPGDPAPPREAGDPPRRIVAEARSAGSLDEVEVIVDGEVLAASCRGQAGVIRVEQELPVGSGRWVAARAHATDATCARFAHTSPVWLRDGPPPARRSDGARRFATQLEGQREQVRARASTDEAARVEAVLDSAETVYRRLAG